MQIIRHKFGSSYWKALITFLAVCLWVLPLNVAGQSEGDEQRQSVEHLRRQARILHTTMHSMLRIVHDRYYREDEGLLIPAHVMKETFRELEKTEGIQLRWLAVEGQPMNTDHIAHTDFEKSAVAALKSGKPFYEDTVDSVYRRAAPITLSNHCLKCHMPDRKSTEDRVAGLMISMPLLQKVPAEDTRASAGQEN